MLSIYKKRRTHIFLCSIFILLSFELFAQKPPSSTDEHFRLAFGRSKHGSGDLSGISFSTGYSRYLTKRTTVHMEVGSTVHNGAKEIFYTGQNGELIDGSVRYTTGGIQAVGGAGYSAIASSHHELQFRLSGIIRYQASSLYDISSTLYPAATGLPVPVTVFVHESPAQTLDVGAAGTVLYNYTFSSRYAIGISGSFQMGVNGDVLSHTSLSIGKRF